nr:aminotransferase class I/II-fold pyridoxal phosphate-dependent enzyme [Acidiferrobacterales bacterium]
KAFEHSKAKGLTPVTVSDGIGSMGGNAPVRALLDLAEKFGGYCYLDDAHGTSILGKNGGGFVLSELNDQLHDRILLASSLAKAFGATGGSISVTQPETAEFIARHANPYIFGGPLSIASVAAIIESSKIHLFSEIYDLQNSLYENIKLFDSFELPMPVINHDQLIPIRGLLLNDERKAIDLGRYLYDHGYLLTCATFPTVERGKPILRLALSALHTDSQIRELIELISSY